MDFFSIPAEVIDANLLPYLGWNDILRFRRVCKWTNAITGSYLKVHPELAPEIQINEEGDKSFQAFMEMAIPTTRIFLNNTSGKEFYENCEQEISTFLEQFGPLIKYLRVDQISLLVYGKEYDFLNALKNLESFVANQYGGYRRGLNVLETMKAYSNEVQMFKKDPRVLRDSSGGCAFPTRILRLLKTLKIGNNYSPIYGNPLPQSQLYLLNGYSLESVAIPFNMVAKPDLVFGEQTCLQGQLASTLALILSHMHLPTVEDSLLKNCKEIDFVGFHNNDNVDEYVRCYGEFWGSPTLLNLCAECSKRGIKLMNVASSWFQGLQFTLHRDHPEIGTSVVSLVNIDPRIFPVEMSNLEKIVITGTCWSSPGAEWQQRRPDWPALKSLDVTVDSKGCRYSEWNPALNRPLFVKMKTKELYGFLFLDVTRLALTDLKLEFKEGDGSLPVPKSELIVASCPNLKKLTLVNWLGTNKALTKFWSGLPGLEEIFLEDCKDLGNVAFVGEDVNAPVFMKLKKLKKLTLKGLDRMPKITDTLFSLIIRHLELTHLFLSSDAPLKSVTLVGIRSLCGGKFAESIKKFPFQDWRLSNISEEKFKQHEVMFRSYNML